MRGRNHLPKAAALCKLRAQASLGPRNKFGTENIETVSDFGVDKPTKLKLNPKASTTGVCNFYNLSGPWIGENAILECVLTN